MQSVLAEVDVLMRGGAAALCLYLATRFIMVRQHCMLATLGALFTVSVAVLVLTVQRPAFYDPASLWNPFFMVGKLSPYLFWLFALSLFDDQFEFRWWHAVPGFATFVNAFACDCRVSFDPPAMALHMMMLLMFGHVFYLGITGYMGDLVDKRRSFRTGVSFLIPVVGLSIVVMDLTSSQLPLSQEMLLVQTGMILAAAGIFTLWVSRLDEALLPPAEPAKQIHQAKLPAADRLELARLEQAVRSGTLYEPGLTIGLLADRIDVPEHRLRRLINQGLGYRNFNAFLNDHRVAEAQRRLADPDLAREQIIQLAYALGYASLAPFNRAFRERVGTSPSAFRAEALETSLSE